MKLLAAAALLLLAAPACGDAEADARAAEYACQQRLVRVAAPRAPAAQKHIGAAFEGLGDAYRATPLDGCTEGQRYTARSLGREADRLTALGRRIGDRDRALRYLSGVAPDPNFMEFMDRLERYEQRRAHLAGELRAMAAAARR